MKDSDIKAAMSSEYQRYAEDLSIWREGLIAQLPALRKAKKEALARGDQEESERIARRYQEILDVLSRH